MQIDTFKDQPGGKSIRTRKEKMGGGGENFIWRNQRNMLRVNMVGAAARQELRRRPDTRSMGGEKKRRNVKIGGAE